MHCSKKCNLFVCSSCIHQFNCQLIYILQNTRSSRCAEQNCGGLVLKSGFAHLKETFSIWNLFLVTGVVHLTGYLVEDSLPDDMEYDEAMTSTEEEESEVDSSEEECKNTV